MFRAQTLPLLTTLASVFAAPLVGQEPPPTGLEVRGVPAINFDSDEGFGYGVIAELYHYGDGGYAPYKWTLQPTIFLTTQGRRDGYAFFDAPHLLGEGWRLGGFAGYERQIATPYYGVGNASEYDPVLESDAGPDPYWLPFRANANERDRHTPPPTLGYAVVPRLWGRSRAYHGHPRPEGRGDQPIRD